MNNSKNFVALLNDSAFRVQETKFNRQAGETMNIDGRPFKVVATGTRNECVAFLNGIIREINRQNRAKMATAPMGAFDKAVLDIMKKHNL